MTELSRALSGAARRLASLGPAWSRPAAAWVRRDGRTLAASDADRAGSLGCAAREVMDAFEGKWQRGDIAVTNDPFHGGVHVCEFTLVRPVGDGAVALRMRLPDIGGFEFGGLAPQSFDTWGEGARFPPVRIRLGKEPRREALDLIALNTRTPRLLGKWLAVMTEEADGLAEIFSRGPIDRAPLARADARAREILSRLAEGRYSAQAEVELPGTGPQAVVRLDATLANGQITLDFTRSDTQVGSALNSTAAHTLDCCLGAIGDALPGFRPDSGAMPAIGVLPAERLITAAALPATTGLAPYLTARSIRRAVIQALIAAGARGVEPDLWWQREGAGRFADEVDAGTLRLHPARVAEALALERSAAEEDR